jgi:hypothetical protein
VTDAVQSARMRLIYVLNAANMASILVSQVLIVPILLKYLGVVNYEHWLYLISLSNICALATLGLDIHGSNGARIAYAAHDRHQAQCAISMTTSLLLGIIVLFFCLSAGVMLLNPTVETAAFAVMILAAPFGIYRSYLSYIVTARTSQVGELITFIAFNLSQAGALAVCAWVDGRIIVMAIVFLLSTICFGIIPLVVYIKTRMADVGLMPVRINWRIVSSNIRVAFPMFSYSAATVAIIHAPIVILSSLPGIPVGSTAAFAISRTLVGIVRQYCLQLARSNGIELSRFLAPEFADKLRKKFISGAAITATLAAVGLGALPPVAEMLISFWTHQPALYDPVVIMIFCIGGVLSAQLQLPMIMPQFTNQAHMVLKPLIFQIALVIGLGVIGSTLFQAAGMVAALSVAELTTLGWTSLRRIIPGLGISPVVFTFLIGVPSTIIMAISAGLSWISFRIVAPQSFFDLVFCGALWGVLALPIAYLVFTRIMKVTV